MWFVFMELWFVLAIVCAVLFGSDAIFAKLSTSNLGVTRVAVLIALVNGPIYLWFYFYWRVDITIGLWEGFLAAISCIIGVIGYLCFFESVGDAQIAVTGTISAAYPALTVVGALVFLSETLTVSQTIGLVAIIGGIAALSYEPNPKSAHAMSRRSLLFALFAFRALGFVGPDI